MTTIVTPLTDIPDENNRFFDNTMIDCARRCNREFYFRHVRHWRRDGVSAALAFGLAMHAAQDVLWLELNKLPNNATPDDMAQILTNSMDAFSEAWIENGMPDWRDGGLDNTALEELYPRTPGRASEILVYYMQKYGAFIREVELLGVEMPFIVPLSEEEPDLFYIGRLDKVFKKDGKIYILDHKTTKSQEKQWQGSFMPSGQFEGYAYAGRMTYGEAFEMTIADGILVQKGTPASQKKQADPQFPAGISFLRLPLKNPIEILEQWHWEVLYFIKSEIDFNAQLLTECTKFDSTMKAYPRRTNACNNYGGCSYKDICAVMGNPIRQLEPPPGFIVEEWRPFNVLDITKGPNED